ncbi:hypothetical protein VWZ88_12625 [Phaeobacter sp. JH20_36]|uniref:hypothetical protein n=1 Tax=unclassified Phaeobacter TaxID=2621772 RepID=UPI003A869875
MRDTALSLDARGMLALLMTYSDEWRFRRDHLCKVAGIGRDKFTRVMRELGEAGYVERVASRLEDGTLIGTEWIIHDDPSKRVSYRGPENPSLGSTEALKNRPPVKPTAGKPAPIRNNKVKEIQLEETPKPPRGADDLFSAENETDRQDETSKAKNDLADIDSAFDEFWGEIWPSHARKAGKADCLKVYRQACTGKHPKADKISPRALNEATKAYIASVRDPQYLKGPLPWLRQPGWEPFVRTGGQGFRWEDLSAAQQNALSDGRCPPSLMENGAPDEVAAYWLSKFRKAAG